MTIHVEQVDVGFTARLRQRVLRPHQTVEELIRSDHDGNTAFAAFADGVVVGSALVYPAPFAEQPQVESAWRLRGMATAEEYRGHGVGAAVVAEVIDYVRTRGGTLLWCNARIPAQGFYERCGFATAGDPWNDPDIGPHIRMWRKV